MFPANVIAPSPIYQSWFRAPIFQQQQQQHPASQASVLRHPGYMVESLLPRTESDSSPSGRDSSDGMTSDAAAAVAAAQAAFLTAAASAAADGDSRQAFNMYRYRQYQLHQQHLQTRNSLATMSCSTPSCLTTPRSQTTRHLATTPDTGDSDDTAVDLVHSSRKTTSSSPSPASSSMSKSSTPRLKFSVSAILSSEISPKNRKGKDNNNAKIHCKILFKNNIFIYLKNYFFICLTLTLKVTVDTLI